MPTMLGSNDQLDGESLAGGCRRLGPVSGEKLELANEICDELRCPEGAGNLDRIGSGQGAREKQSLRYREDCGFERDRSVLKSVVQAEPAPEPVPLQRGKGSLSNLATER
jgi:hypothetical protein